MTADLIARCRAAIEASDETAKAAGRSQSWSAQKVMAELQVDLAPALHIAANDPSTRLALNWALTVVLDGIADRLARHAAGRPLVAGSRWCSASAHKAHPCVERLEALDALAAIAEALGVQEEP